MTLRVPKRFSRRGIAALIGFCAAAVVAGCTDYVPGQAVSMMYDPFYVGGLPVTDGPSGQRPDAVAPSGTVKNTDDGESDRLALLSVNDVEEYWKQAYPEYFDSRFLPVGTLLSYDSTDPRSPKVCGSKTYDEPNAMYCPPDNLMAWDRGVLVPAVQKYFGDMAVAGLVAHEYGHAIQHMADLVTKSSPGIVLEQQADCFAGVYLRWVTEGSSPRFTLNTGDGLSRVLAAAIAGRDPVMTPKTEDLLLEEYGHGTALDRVSAVQMGFDSGPRACSAIDLEEVRERRGDLPMSLQPDSRGRLQTGEVPIDEETLTDLIEVLGEVFPLDQPPTLSYDTAACPDAQPSSPVSYCPATNTIAVDLPALRRMAVPGDTEQGVLVQGDDTALSIVMARYMFAVQRQRGLPLDSPRSAMLTACLTGVAHREMSTPGRKLAITAGDLDEAVAGLLTNGLVASDVNGGVVPAGFTRITAFRSGVVGDEQQCFGRFGDSP